MKNKRYITVIAVLIALLLSSCEKILDIDIDGMERYIVTNAMLCGDSTMFVNVSYSRFFLDNRQFDAVENALVAIDINGVQHNFVNRDGANYWFDTPCHEGDTLTLNLTVGDKNITGGTRVPYRAIVSEPNALIDTTLPITNYKISFTLSDRGGERNWYYVYIVEKDSGIRWNRQEHLWDTIDTIANPVFICTNERIVSPSVNYTEGIMYYYQHLLFSDSLIDGDDVDITLSMPKMRDTAEHPMKRTYKLVVKTMSREAFLYTCDVYATHSTSQYFAEPRTIYSNLSGNNFGIFAAMTRWERMLEFHHPDTQFIKKVYRKSNNGKGECVAGRGNYCRQY